MGNLGIGIMNLTAFSLLANRNPEVDKNQKINLTIESLSFYIGPSGSTCLLDLAESGSSVNKSNTITLSGSSVGSSSEVNSPVSFAATENTKKELEKIDRTQEEPDEGAAAGKPYNIQRTSPPKVVASPGAYINYASLSPKLRKRTVMKIMQKIARKSTNQGAIVKRRRRKFTPTGSGELSCQLSTTGQKYPPIQEGKF
jgi:hypothetical protein